MAATLRRQSKVLLHVPAVKIVEEFTVQITSFPDVSGHLPLLAVMPRLRRLLLAVMLRLRRLLPVVPRLRRRLLFVEMPRLRGKINFELLVIVNFVGGIIPVWHSVTDAADVVQLYPGL